VFAFLFRTAAFCVLAFVTSSGERFETILRRLSMSPRPLDTFTCRNDNSHTQRAIYERANNKEGASTSIFPTNKASGTSQNV
jgi:hypothetical protein